MARHQYSADIHVHLNLPADAFSTGYRRLPLQDRDGTEMAAPGRVSVEGNTFTLNMDPDAAIELHKQLSAVISFYGLTAEDDVETTP